MRFDVFWSHKQVIERGVYVNQDIQQFGTGNWCH